MYIYIHLPLESHRAYPVNHVYVGHSLEACVSGASINRCIPHR